MEVAVFGASRHRDIMKAESITTGGRLRKNAAASQQTPATLLFISFILVTYDCGRDQAVD
ncbi:hypothetical protein HNR22_004075 [Micromonospora jinlongensis]|uniref:Uncharacterized protein n=1 Tax=Micromonospora jinlongensis TaxID=1287877 RepID=A0A7Y9X557_9ACTN|nr:hypothetical protein [Micromonospora jinlongensis]NYH44348.1 hypothetical protein [Micromonospora jinlongensis]